MTATLIPPLVFVTTALFVLALFRPRPRALRDRLSAYGERRGLIGRERLLSRSAVERLVVPGVAAMLARITALAPDRLRQQAQAELERAGQPMGVPTFLGLRAAIMFALPLLYVLVVWGGELPLTPMTVVAPLLLFWMGQRLPRLWLKSRVRARERRIERAMAGAMDLITVSMEAGLGFDAALGKVVEKTTGPLRDEFDRVLRELTLGKQRRDALRDLAHRVPLPDMASFVAAVVQADQMGLGLGQTMRGLAEELRVKRRQRAEEQAMKAPVKMLIPLVFFIFPSMLLVVVGPAMVIITTQVFGSVSR